MSDEKNAKLDKILMVQTQLMNAGFNLEAFMQLVADQMMLLTPATGVVVELVDGDYMVYEAASGTVKEYIGLRLLKKDSISGLCVDEKKVLCSKDTDDDPRVNKEACRKVQARSLVVAPLFHHGNAVGVLKVVSVNPNAFNEEDIQTLQIMTGVLGSGLAQQIIQEFRNF